jgi:hypothetical protein
MAFDPRRTIALNSLILSKKHVMHLIARTALPSAPVLMVSFLSNQKVIRIPRSANFRYLDYSEGACVQCNHPIRNGICPKHG